MKVYLSLGTCFSWFPSSCAGRLIDNWKLRSNLFPFAWAFHLRGWPQPKDAQPKLPLRWAEHTSNSMREMICVHKHCMYVGSTTASLASSKRLPHALSAAGRDGFASLLHTHAQMNSSTKWALGPAVLMRPTEESFKSVHGCKRRKFTSLSWNQ